MKGRDWLILGGLAIGGIWLLSQKKPSDSGSAADTGFSPSPLDAALTGAGLFTAVNPLTAPIAAGLAPLAVLSNQSAVNSIQNTLGNAGAFALAQSIAAGQNLYSGATIATAKQGQGGTSQIAYAQGTNVLAATQQAASLGFGNVSTVTGPAYVPPPSSYSSQASYISAAKSVGAVTPTATGTAVITSKTSAAPTALASYMARGL